MRYIEELRSTTNNYVYNRLRIPYESSCGYCGLGSRCNRTKKYKWYHVSRRYKNKYSPIYGYRAETAEFQYEGTYPNWKMVSKNKKQWMNKPVKTIPNEYQVQHMRERYPDNVEFIWRGNDRRNQY